MKFHTLFLINGLIASFFASGVALSDGDQGDRIQQQR